MSDGITIDSEAFSRDVGRFALLSGRSFADELKNQAKGVMREVLKVTPPFNQNNTSISSAKGSGLGAMRRDLAGGGRSRGNRRAGVFVVLADSMIDSALDTGIYQSENVRLFVRKDGTVYGTEKQYFKPNASMQELRDHHQRYFKNGKMTTAGSYERNIGRWKFLDQMVIRRSTFERYLKTLEPRVGFLGGGFKSAAKGLGVSIPLFMRRHSAPGGLAMNLTGDDLSIVIRNDVRYAGTTRDLARRFQWAVMVQQNKMERQVPHLLRRHQRIVN
jgi:outer membrane lipoprotein SlyB